MLQGFTHSKWGTNSCSMRGHLEALSQEFADRQPLNEVRALPGGLCAACCKLNHAYCWSASECRTNHTALFIR